MKQQQPARNECHRHRVFVSYSHDDAVIVRAIVRYIEEVCRLSVIWDQTFAYGQGFHDQIRDFISHAHVFLPVLTQEATERGWVQQEIGFAMAMNIPVLPITIDASPGQMISIVHAVKLEAITARERQELASILETLDAADGQAETALTALKKTRLWKCLERELCRSKLLSLIDRHSDSSFARYQCADYQEERTILMVRHANSAFDLHHRGLYIRQLGGLSSFHIPIEEPSNEIWKRRYGPAERPEFHKKWQRAERVALSQHAAEAGCSLIVNPYHPYLASGPRAYAVRLLCLYQFLLNWKSDKPLVVAISDKLGFHESITIVGDVFAAIAIAGSASGGYMQTVFTTHAPSMQNRQDQFDRRLAECLNEWSWQPETSRMQTADEIARILSDCLGIKADAVTSPVKLTEHLPDSYDLPVGKPDASRQKPATIPWPGQMKLTWPPAPPQDDASPPAPSPRQPSRSRRRSVAGKDRRGE